MQTFDIFNGDADGICALLQSRLHRPLASTLITGVKRDISLVQQVPSDRPSHINVFDLSLDRNRTAIDERLQAGCHVFYADHHYPGDSLPVHPHFKALIDTQPTTCTSLLINQQLQGRFANWAIVAAFGDNLDDSARALAQQQGLSHSDTALLKELGTCINYNGYGASLDDLHYHPAELFQLLLNYADPLDFIHSCSSVFQRLRSSYTSDLALGLGAPVMARSQSALVVQLPDLVWARRVSGVLGNILANANPDKACAVVTHSVDGCYLVSIRSPLHRRTGADELARQFPTGGGRKAAAGIASLPSSQLNSFLDTFSTYWNN